MKKFLLISGLLSLVFLAGCTKNQIACTEEAMICPDGSAVGRTGPNCEFSPCPEIQTGNILTTGNIVTTENIVTPDKNTISKKVCNKEDNCCILNSDCTYIGYAGSCNTPEYIAKKQKEAEEQGMLIGESPSQGNGTCTCEKNLCVTHK